MGIPATAMSEPETKGDAAPPVHEEPAPPVHEGPAPPVHEEPAQHQTVPNNLTTREGVEALRKRKHDKKSIFKKHGVTSSATLSTGDVVAVPFHTYNSEAFIIWGTADQDWVQSQIRGQWKPILDHHSGHNRAQVAIWVLRCEDSVVGPFLTFKLCFSVWPEDRVDQADVDSGVESQRLFSEGAAHPYVYKVWTDSDVYANYCKEVLKMDAELCSGSEIHIKPREKAVERFRLESDGEMLLTGTIYTPELSWCCHPSVWSTWGCCFPCSCGGRGTSDQWSFAIPPMAGGPTGENPMATFAFEQTPKVADALHDDNLLLGGIFKEMKFIADMYHVVDDYKFVLQPPITLGVAANHDPNETRA